jgi:uncharacterized membrane protein
LERNSLPHAASNPVPAQPEQDLPGKPRRWSIIAAGLLLFALALVVIYTSRAAFFSPLALVVVAAIGLAALLLELRFRKNVSPRVRAPLWLNVVGLVFALGAVFSDLFHVGANLMLVASLGAVGCFAISGIVILHALRKKKV